MLLQTFNRDRVRYFTILLFTFSFLRIFSQAIIITSPVATTSFCAGASVNIAYTLTGTFLNTPAANVFSAQISDFTGSFGGTPETIGTRTSIANGTITCTLPSTLLTSGLYRFRIVSSNPPVNGSDNGANLNIFAITLNAPTLSQTSFCQAETFTVNFTQSSCAFVNIPVANVYSIQLSNSAGSFTSPVVIGTRTATTAGAITCNMPAGTPAGAGYRIRVVACSPDVTSSDNGSNLTVMAAAGTPSVFGNGSWRIYCYNARNDYSTNYMGFYTETSLNFNTTTRWAAGVSPSAANATGGAAFSGCTFGSANYSYAYKRTNVACGYYRIDIPTHRTEVYLIINGVTVFQHTVCCDAHTGAWEGIIEATDEFEIRSSSASSNGFLSVNFVKLNQVTMSAPVTICAGTNASLTVKNTGTLPVTYAWTPTVSVSPTTGASVIATPVTTTIYTVTATDTGTPSCAVFSNTVTVTVNPVPIPTTSITTTVICSGFTTSSITASGANAYTWAPAAGLNTTTGNGVIANPTVTTVYTITGSNNCATVNATRTLTVRTPPSTPSPTAFGSGVWNVYCYNGTGFVDFYGFYPENNLSFDSRNRWLATATPSTATGGTAGVAYSGCNLVPAGHGTISKRTNFTCGYYSIDIAHDDVATLFVDNVQVYTNSTAGSTQTAVWTGFLGPASLVEIRHSNAAGNSYIAATFSPVSVPVLSPPVTICLGTTATLTAVNIPGTTYSWSPAVNLSTTTGTISISSATVNTNYTCVITDTLTGCSSSNTTSLTINPVPTTTVSPTSATINCAAQIYTLNTGGANTYTWAPSAGLNTTTGNSVIASPTVNTIYTVSGSNNCSVVTAVVNVSVVPLVNSTVFPATSWNAYCFNSTTFTNYFGYYTENGSGTSGYDFNTNTRWTSGAAPSTANAVNGQAYLGCTMPTNNWSMSFKRRGFTCSTYSIVVSNNDDAVTIFVNGTQVATRSALSAVTAVMWVGVLSPSASVEFRLTQTTAANSGLSVSFVAAAANPSLSVWAGATSTDWFNTNNWCGSGVPTLSDDVIIYNTGALFQPAITATGAACNNLTISAAAAATASTSIIPAASLTIGGSFGLDVYGDWMNRGAFIPATGTVSILGTGPKTVSCTTTQTFNVLVLNNAGDIAMSAGTHRISNRVDFTSGIVTLNGSLIFLNGATAVNASSASHVEGQIVKFGNQSFEFPLGLNGFYRPISISAPVLTTDNFTAQYFYTDPSPSFTHTSKDATIHHISRCEHWILNRTGGSSIVSVRLSWDANSCGVTDINDLLVARWDAGQVKWKDHGNGGTVGNATAGSLVSSAPVSVFSPFTLGSKTFLNPLPVELLGFSAECVKEGVDIKWSTATEKNNDYFTVERSADGIHWDEIHRKMSEVNSTTKKNYLFTDRHFSDETVYYRLGQVDKDQRKELFRIATSDCGLPENSFRFHPNPATDEINLVFNVSQYDADGVLKITDNLGVTVYSENMDLKKGTNLVLLPLKLQAGVYFISYSSFLFKGEVKKLVIQ